MKMNLILQQTKPKQLLVATHGQVLSIQYTETLGA
jgi:hypothetical protein